MTQILEARGISVFYRAQGRAFAAIDNIDLDVAEGETLGLIGESGCGKSTLGRAILQLPRPSQGSVTFEGHDLTTLSFEEMRQVRARLQVIFQDPVSALNPRRRIGDIVAEPLAIAGIGTPAERVERVRKALEAVGIDPETAMERRPHEFSGGQCQRICIARALVLEPKLVICDEPVSSLDVSVQAQILNLLEDMKARYGLTLLFISHDMAVVKNISDRVAVMYLGRICEIAPAKDLYDAPAHPYTAALIAAIPAIDGAQGGPAVTAHGELPSPLDPPSGCRFRTRCPYADARCAAETPPLHEIAPGRVVACHYPLGHSTQRITAAAPAA